MPPSDTNRPAGASTGPNLPSPRASTPPSTEDGTGAYVPLQDAETPQAVTGAAPPLAVSVPGYEIEGVLGRGGMGVVYKARHLALNRPVALKMVLAGDHAGPRELARFRLEAVAAARLQHPNIVQIHEVGEADGHPYLALEFVEGGNLARRVDGRPMPAGEAARLVEALARAMQLAHSRNVVHRDLKPANVLLAADGTPKIADFGLARQLDADSGETQVGAVMGTPSYMAPEQASGHAYEAGPAADVYALGAILYACLTGQPPFRGRTTPETLEQVRALDPQPPSRLRPGVPLDLETVCLKCLRKEPEHRYASAAELADELGRYLRGEPVLARPVGRLERAWRWCWRNPALALLSGGLAVALVGGLISSISFALVAQKESAAAKEAGGRAAEREKDALVAQRLADENAAKARASERLAYDRAYNSDLRLLQQAWEKSQFDFARELLDRQRPEKTDGTERRHFEWHHWQRQDSLRLLTFRGHADAVGCVAFSPDGKTVASGAGENYATRAWGLRLWDSRTGKVLRSMTGPGRRVMGVAFSPDGGRLASADLAGAHVWDVKSGKELFRLEGHTRYPSALAWGRDGKLIATGGGDMAVRLWDAATGKQCLVLRDAGLAQVVCVAFSHDSTRVAAGGNGDCAVRVWEAATGKKIHTLPFPLKPAPAAVVSLPCVRSVAFSPDGRWLAAGSHDGRAAVWGAARGEKPRTLEVSGDSVGVTFSPDSRQLVTGGTGLKFWGVEMGQQVFNLKGVDGTTTSAAFSPDGERIVSGHGERAAVVWDATPAKRAAIPCPSGAVLSLAFSQDGGRLFAGMREGPARAYDLSTNKELGTFGDPRPTHEALAVHPSGQQAVLAGAAMLVEVWRPLPAKLLHRERAVDFGVRAAAYSPDGMRFATIGFNGAVQVWSSTNFRALRRFQGGGNGMGVAWSPTGAHLALRDTAGVTVWEADTGRVVAKWPDPSIAVGPLVFSPDGKQVATANYGGAVTFWGLNSGKAPRRLTGHTSWVTGVAYSPDGKRIASSSHDGCVKVWSADAGEELLSLAGDGPFYCVAFSPDGKKLFAGAGRGIRIWEGFR